MVSRRHFIFGTAIVSAGAAVGIQLYSSRKLSPGEQAVNELIGRLAELPGAVRFGEMYRKQQNRSGAEISAKSVSRRLTNYDEDMSQYNIEELLEKQIQIDLQTKQVYLIDDWYLTRIEAELCALAAMLERKT